MKYILLCCCAFFFACQDLGLPSLNLERMIEQAKYEPMEASQYFSDGKVNQLPPENTIPWGQSSLKMTPRVTGVLADGLEQGVYTEQIPLMLTPKLLSRGQNRFDIYCAVCHGILADGNARVASRMKERKPPSLLTPVYKAYPAGRIYQAIDKGFGFMPSYARELSLEERWAVVAYVKALQFGHGVSIANLPAPLQEEARESLQ